MFTHSLSRRELLRTGSAAALLVVTGRVFGAGSTLGFQLKETAGLRRFGYPAHTILPNVRGGATFRLLRDGKPVPAQFRRVVGTEGQEQIELDFNASPDPLGIEALYRQLRRTRRDRPGAETGNERRGGRGHLPNFRIRTEL